MHIIKKIIFWFLLFFLSTSLVFGRETVGGNVVTMGQDSKIDRADSDKYETAIAMARNGQYSTALELLHELVESFNSRPAVLFDYAVTAVWAGEYVRAVRIYETRILPLQQIVPAYVKVNVAGAYYQLGRFQSARELYHELAAADDLRAAQWEAECLTQLGETTEAMLLYEELLARPGTDSGLYVSRALAYISVNDAVSAMQDAQTALKLAATGDDAAAKTAEIRAVVASAFIRNGDYAQAIVLLRSAVQSKTATLFMESDYILALSRNGDYEAAIAVGKMLWSKRENVPIYGQRALADAYLHAGQPNEAVALYRSIEAEKEFSTADRQSLAYAYLLAGKIKAGMALYRELLSSGVEKALVLAYDAEAFLDRGDYAIGTQLFQLLLTYYPEERLLRERFADRLAENGLFREAWEQYEALFLQPGGHLAAAAGIAITATSVGDYQIARQAIGTLQDEFSQEPATAYAMTIFARRQLGEAEFGYSQTNDYKGNNIRLRQIASEQRLGDRFTVLAALVDRLIADDVGDEKFTTYSGGIRYTDMKRIVTVWGDWNYEPYSGYRLQYRYFFGEQSTFELSRERLPVYDVQALAAGTMLTANRISWDQQIGKKDAMTLGMEMAAYSDGNRRRSYDFFWNHRVISAQKREFSWFLYCSETKFAHQTINRDPTGYESPERREAYGLGLRHRWQKPETYWEGTAAIEWGRDRPEPLDVSPHARFEYGYRPSQSSALSIGVEYGARTDRTNHADQDLRFGYRQYDLMYRLEW